VTFSWSCRRERGQPRSGALVMGRVRRDQAPTGGALDFSTPSPEHRSCRRVNYVKLDIRTPPLVMALARPLPPLWHSLLPALNGPVRPVLDLPFLRRLSQPFLALPTPFAALAIPSISLPSFPSLGEIWDGILKAVPKKKTSYRKKRQRFMAGKALKDITALTKCPACGRVKRAHLLCPYCVDGVFSSLTVQISPEVPLTAMTAIKTSIFGEHRWGIRNSTPKQAKQMAREDREEARRERSMEPDPRKEKEEQVLKHTGWKR
jgi:large subunit ribosomal protein L32